MGVEVRRILHTGEMTPGLILATSAVVTDFRGFA